MGKYSFLAAACCILIFSGCGPKFTYPGNTAGQSIEAICLKEFKLTVEGRVAGKTAGALVPVDPLLDERGQVPMEVQEKMGRAMQAVTRVALSTDRPIDFCMVILRDVKTGAQFSMTRSLDDMRRANAEALGVEESMLRTVFGQAITDVNNPSFVLKDIQFPDFLAEQIVQRIRVNFAKVSLANADRQPAEQALVEGSYAVFEGKKTFRFSTVWLGGEDAQKTILLLFHSVNDAFLGYRFTDFDEIQIQDYLNRQKLTLDRQTLLDFQAKKITEKELLERCVTESQPIQQALKLFGFTVPPDTIPAAPEVVPT